MIYVMTSEDWLVGWLHRFLYINVEACSDKSVKGVKMCDNLVTIFEQLTLTPTNVTSRTVPMWETSINYLLRVLYTCCYPQYITWRKRAETFLTCPSSLPLSSTELVNAGYFYCGESDRTQCFVCGTILTEWKVNDSAMGEHEKFTPTCSFIRLVKCLQGELSLSTLMSGLKTIKDELIELRKLCSRDNISFRIACDLGHDSNLVTAVILRRYLNGTKSPYRAHELVSDVLDAEESEMTYEMNVFNLLAAPIPAMEEIREENTRLLLRDMCRYCCKEKATYVVIPCGHMIAGSNCMELLQPTVCIACDQPITRMIKVYRP